MKYRKPRIAWSVVWGFACLLLTILWIRSYKHQDHLGRADLGTLPNIFRSAVGNVYAYWDEDRSIPPGWHTWTVEYEPQITNETWIKSRFGRNPVSHVPHWFLVALTFTAFAAPWLLQMSWRFSLRTLLIATTLVAVVLGLIVWLG